MGGGGGEGGILLSTGNPAQQCRYIINWLNTKYVRVQQKQKCYQHIKQQTDIHRSAGLDLQGEGGSHGPAGHPQGRAGFQRSRKHLSTWHVSAGLTVEKTNYMYGTIHIETPWHFFLNWISQAERRPAAVPGTEVGILLVRGFSQAGITHSYCIWSNRAIMVYSIVEH
jgi:hypothetical protein